MVSKGYPSTQESGSELDSQNRERIMVEEERPETDYSSLEQGMIIEEVPQGNKDITAEENPEEDVLDEIEDAPSPRNTSVLSIKRANDWIEEAAKRPNPKLYCFGLIVQSENTVLFAPSGVGKSILAVQLADIIAQTERILYLDLELSDKQFQMRYTDPVTGKMHVFSPNFMRAELDPERIGRNDLEQEILNSIESVASGGVKFVVVDNLTFICHDAEKSTTASEFMMKLIRLKKKYELTLIVVAHTPKRRKNEPITQNDLAGSSKLISFFDSGIALCRSARDTNLRYLKQVKVRTGEIKYDADHVLLLELVKPYGFLHFEKRGEANEIYHLKNPGSGESKEEIYAVLQGLQEKKTMREIANELGIPLGKVQRRKERAVRENITLPANYSRKKTPVSAVSKNENPIQPIHDTDRNSPNNK